MARAHRTVALLFNLSVFSAQPTLSPSRLGLDISVENRSGGDGSGKLENFLIDLRSLTNVALN